MDTSDPLRRRRATQSRVGVVRWRRLLWCTVLYTSSRLPRLVVRARWTEHPARGGQRSLDMTDRVPCSRHPVRARLRALSQIRLRPGPCPGYCRDQCWLLPPLQVQISTGVPFAVPPPVTSRQSPDPRPTTVPSELRFHCWLAPPVQSDISTLVPAAVELPGTSRHLLP